MGWIFVRVRSFVRSFVLGLFGVGWFVWELRYHRPSFVHPLVHLVSITNAPSSFLFPFAFPAFLLSRFFAFLLSIVFPSQQNFVFFLFGWSSRVPIKDYLDVHFRFRFRFRFLRVRSFVRSFLPRMGMAWYVDSSA
jgi:hypothetical protein